VEKMRKVSTNRHRMSFAVFGIIFLVIANALTLSAGAQQTQPNSVNPSGSVQSEQQLLDQARKIEGRGTLPNVQSHLVEQPVGRLWSRVQTVLLPLIGAIAIVGMLCLLTLFYLWRGSMRFGERAGQTLPRFNVFERLVHWMTTICFVILAVSGLNITFGAKLLLPVIGADAFSAWSLGLKYLHNYLALPFAIGVGLMFVLLVRSNLPARIDIEWVKRGGGMFGGEAPPTGRFNAGEKMIFWTTVFGGGAVVATGYALIFPFYGTGIVAMQLAHIVHAAVGLLFIAAILVHIYMATLGTEGAFEGMMTGEVDVNWAKHHHSLWYEERMGVRDKDSAAPVNPVVTTPT
jgi:formate dehydrogenase subunit gamma